VGRPGVGGTGCVNVTDATSEAADDRSPLTALTVTEKVPYAVAVSVHVNVDVVHESITALFCFIVATYDAAFADAFHDTKAVFDVPT
jgi:hypothetical protein